MISLVSGSWGQLGFLPWSLYPAPSDQDKLVTTWLYVVVWKKKSLLPCLPAFLQAEKENKAPRCLSWTAFLPSTPVCSDHAFHLRSRPRVYRTVSLSLLLISWHSLFIPRLCVCLGLNKHSRILFLFSFVLKSDVLKGWGAIQSNLTPYRPKRSGMEGCEEELGGKNGVLCGNWLPLEKPGTSLSKPSTDKLLQPFLWNIFLRPELHVVHSSTPAHTHARVHTHTHTHTHTHLCLLTDWARRIWQSAWPMAKHRACSHCLPGVPVQTQVRVSACSNFIPGWWRRLTEQQGGCYFGSLRGSGLYKAYCCDLHCFAAVSHSCAFCHNMSSVQTFTHTHPRSSWGMRREVCAGGVCVYVLTLLVAHAGGGLLLRLGGGDCM